MTYRKRRNWESKHLAKIALYLGDRISVIKALQLPHVGNVMHICARPELSGSDAIDGNVTETLQIPSGLSVPKSFSVDKALHFRNKTLQRFVLRRYERNAHF